MMESQFVVCHNMKSLIIKESNLELLVSLRRPSSSNLLPKWMVKNWNILIMPTNWKNWLKINYEQSKIVTL